MRRKPQALISPSFAYMLKRLHIQNFTVFAEADFEFGPGLNVVVGTNGTGKSHVLKLGYAVLRSMISGVRLLSAPVFSTPDSPLTSLKNIFRPSPPNITKLIRRGAASQTAVIEYTLSDERVSPVELHISTELSYETKLAVEPADATEEVAHSLAPPVLIPAKEILTLGWMRPASSQLVLPVDETYLDLLTQLSGLPLRQPEPAVAAAMRQITPVLDGGEVEEENGVFYLVFPKAERLVMNMVAEGLRKFSTLQKLLANGSLTSKTTLFWDEPEANLNPALLRKMAAVLAELARQGFQIVLATHSLFLLKELHILSRQPDAKPLPVRYFGLNTGADGATTVVTRDDFELLPDIVALDEELAQADTLEGIFATEDRSANADV